MFSCAALAFEMPAWWACPAGKYTSSQTVAAGTTGLSIVHSASENGERGSTYQLYCRFCPAGKYQPTASGKRGCAVCRAGQNQPFRGQFSCNIDTPPATAAATTSIAAKAGGARMGVHWVPSGEQELPAGVTYAKLAPPSAVSVEAAARARVRATAASRARAMAAAGRPCRPGRWGVGGGVHHCKECAPGRWSTAGARTAACSGLCLPGRFGLGGSTSSECTGGCPNVGFCREGSTAPDSSGVCPRGRYSTEASGDASSCTLSAPKELRPKNGYETSVGEQAACVLDKSMKLIEILYAFKRCHRFDQPRGKLCYGGVAEDLTSDATKCCEGNEHIVLPHSQTRCKRGIAPWLGAIRKVLLPRLLPKANENNDAEELHPQKWSAAQQARDQALILPIFQLGLDTARVLYGRDSEQAADLTDAAGSLLHLCSDPSVDCHDMDSIVRFVRHFYCSFFAIKAADCS